MIDMKGKKQPAVGEEFYTEIVKRAYYVDKTLLIKDIMDDTCRVLLFTRPRRFGKTLNMTMLEAFFEKTNEDNSVYFRDKRIWAECEEYTEHCGKYPVVWLSLKDTLAEDAQGVINRIGLLIGSEYERHSELEENDYYKRIVDNTASNEDLEQAIGRLCRLLYKIHGTKPILLIDEYDAPINNTADEKLRNTVIAFMRNMFSAALKTNRYLTRAVLTGVTRIAKESLFSGLNNLSVYSVLDKRFSEYFGFTEAEIAEIVQYYGAEDKLSEIKEWYDGYSFGSTEIYNPWSVTKYFYNDCKPAPYWVNTASNSLIGELLLSAPESDWGKLQQIIGGGTAESTASSEIVYKDIHNTKGAIFSFLLSAGYLKSIKRDGEEYTLTIPNYEIRAVIEDEVINRFADMGPNGTYYLKKAFIKCDTEGIKKWLSEFLLSSVSYHDMHSEAFAHGLIMGLLSAVSGGYELKSNIEAGDGRPDILMTPKREGLPGIVIEIKSKSGLDKDELKALAREAMEQINTNRYAEPLIQNGIKNILKFGVAFSGKNAEAVTEEQSN